MPRLAACSRTATWLAALVLAALPGPRAAASPADLVRAMAGLCLTADPAGLAVTPAGFDEVPDPREWPIFAGARERYWLAKAGASAGILFTPTRRACEFAVRETALDAAGMQSFAAQAILAVRAWAGDAEDFRATLPERIPTFEWTAVPPGFTAPLSHRVEVIPADALTLVRSVVTLN